MIFHLVLFFFALFGELGLDLFLLLLVDDLMFAECPFKTSSWYLVNEISLVFERFLLFRQLLTLDFLLVLFLEL